MAKQLDKRKVRMGSLILMENTKRKATETKTHYALKVEDEDGGNERWLLFREKWLGMETLVSRGLADKMKAGRLYKATRNEKTVSLCRICDQYDGALIIVLTERRLKMAEERAKKHPEDIPVQGKLSDLMD